MQYRVEQVAAASGVKVDTVRFYQNRGLIAPPRREGRVAIYEDSHLDRSRQIRRLRGQGFSLAHIGRLAVRAADAGPADDTRELEAPESALLTALAQESIGSRTLDRSQLAAETGVPESVIEGALSSGLLQPTLGGDDAVRFSSSDAEMLRSGLALLGAGLPLAELLELSGRHARNIEQVTEAAIDLFDDHVRKVADGQDPDAVARTFRELLPMVTRLVALHFQRTLVARAIERLRAKGEGPALERALLGVAESVLEEGWKR